MCSPINFLRSIIGKTTDNGINAAIEQVVQVRGVQKVSNVNSFEFAHVLAKPTHGVPDLAVTESEGWRREAVDDRGVDIGVVQIGFGNATDV